jgi:hypothetical protein
MPEAAIYMKQYIKAKGRKRGKVEETTKQLQEYIRHQSDA